MMNCFGDRDTEILLLKNSEQQLTARVKHLDSVIERRQSELAALRDELERLKSESFEGLYNAAIDERDVLREELAEVSGTLEFNTNCWARERAVMIDKNQTLTADLLACGRHRKAAEQRNAEGSAALQTATRILGRALPALNPRNSLAYEVRHFLAAHRKTKPTESGASE